MTRAIWHSTLLIAGVMWPIVSMRADASVTLNLPSPTSIRTCDGLPPVPLDNPGEVGECFNAGDNLVQTFTGTGLASTTSSEWQFSMFDFTAAGVLNTFALLINSVQVGTFSVRGAAVPIRRHMFST